MLALIGERPWVDAKTGSICVYPLTVSVRAGRYDATPHFHLLHRFISFFLSHSCLAFQAIRYRNSFCASIIEVLTCAQKNGEQAQHISGIRGIRVPKERNVNLFFAEVVLRENGRK